MSGRPTKYSEEIVAKAQAYLDGFYGGEYKAKVENEHSDEIIPSIEGLSNEIGIARSTIYEWQKHEDKLAFSDILEGILSRQAQLLINKGLQGKFNPQITKLALGKHGYHDKVDGTLKATIGLHELADEQIDDELQRLLNGSE